MGTTACRVEGTDKVCPEKSSRFASADQARAYMSSTSPSQPHEGRRLPLTDTRRTNDESHAFA